MCAQQRAEPGLLHGAMEALEVLTSAEKMNGVRPC